MTTPARAPEITGAQRTLEDEVAETPTTVEKWSLMVAVIVKLWMHTARRPKNGAM